MVTRTRRTSERLRSRERSAEKQGEQSSESIPSVKGKNTRCVVNETVAAEIEKSRRRSRRLASEGPEEMAACSGDNSPEAVNNGSESSMSSRRCANVKSKSAKKNANEVKELQNDAKAHAQSPPVALRTRSHSSSGPYDLGWIPPFTGITVDEQSAAAFTSTPKKRLTPASTPRRKRVSVIPQMEKIAEEQPKSKSDTVVEGKEKRKSMLRKSRILSRSPGTDAELPEEMSLKGTVSENVEMEEADVVSNREQLTGSLPGTTEKPSHKLLADFPESPVRHSEKVLELPIKQQEKSEPCSPEKSPKPQSENAAKSAQDTDHQIKTLENVDICAWPLLGDFSSLWKSRNDRNFLVKNIEKAYSLVNDIDPAVPTISQELITTDNETVWQQIAYGNKKFHRYFAKQKPLLDLALPNERKAEKSAKLHLPRAEPRFAHDDDDDTTSDESDADLFHLTEEQIKNLERDFDNEQTEYDDGNDGAVSNSEDDDLPEDCKKRRRWKSAVDDRFFSLAEMEEYLDKQEKDGSNMEENFFEQFDKDGDDLADVEADYRYEDFFGSTSDASEGTESGDASKLKKPKKALQSSEVRKSSKKKVTFADEIDESSDNDNNDAIDDSGDENNYDNEPGGAQSLGAPVLLGQMSEEKEAKSEFQIRQQKLHERISSIENANLAPRSWDLSGEVTAVEREENTMLEKYLDFDQSAPCPPIITVDLTAQLEAMIIQRIKDKAFDDVVRTERKADTNVPYREPVVEQEVKKSLAEVYEEQYQKTQQRVGNEEKTNAKHEEIKKLMSSLFQKLNALCHYHYIPPEVQPEIRIVNNMPSLQKEEVGPMASTDAVLLAPEEVHKHMSGPIKGDDERTSTDRSRARRKKKLQKWQHKKQLERQQAESAVETNEVPAKKKKRMSQYGSAGKKTKLTSTSFFQRLQNTANEEVRSKRQKMNEFGPKKKKLSTNYKL